MSVSFFDEEYKSKINEYFKVDKQRGKIKLVLCAIAFTLTLIPVISVITCWPLNEQLRYATDWSMWLTFSHILISAKVNHVDKSPTMSWLIAAHLTFELVLISNIFVVVFYWTLIHYQTIHTEKDTCRYYHYYTVHSLPAISVMILWYNTEVRICKDHWKVPFALGCLYFVFNFIHVRVLGNKQLYWFLGWNDWNSYFIAVGILIVFVMLWFVLAQLSYKVKPFKK